MSYDVDDETIGEVARDLASYGDLSTVGFAEVLRKHLQPPPEPELLPCPHCGLDVQIEGARVNRFAIQCCSRVSASTKEDVAKIWNHRHKSAELVALREVARVVGGVLQQSNYTTPHLDGLRAVFDELEEARKP